MKSWLALAFLLLAGCEQRAQPVAAPPRPVDPRGHELLPPGHGIYTGAYIDFGEREDDVTLEKIEAFEELVGKRQAIVASSSYWGEQSFPAANLQIIARHGAIPLVFWSPWDRPYEEERGPDQYSLTSILAGAHDAYIDRWADDARAFGGPILLSFGNEANGSWFPWSGVFYGGGRVVPGSNPPVYEGPETFKRAWRYLVDRFRARGAVNVRWVLHLMDYSSPKETWNESAQYFPGPDYVDWLGLSIYGAQFPSDDSYPNFFSLFDWPYTEIARLDPEKPIMLCEWGVGEFPARGDKGEWIREAWKIMGQREKYPRLQAAVFWHERWQNGANSGGARNGENAGKYSDLRANSSAGALRAYREGVASPVFLSAPILRKVEPSPAPAR